MHSWKKHKVGVTTLPSNCQDAQELSERALYQRLNSSRQPYSLVQVSMPMRACLCVCVPVCTNTHLGQVFEVRDNLSAILQVLLTFVCLFIYFFLVRGCHCHDTVQRSEDYFQESVLSSNCESLRTQTQVIRAGQQVPLPAHFALEARSVNRLDGTLQAD